MSCCFSHNWLRVFPAPEFVWKPQLAGVFGDGRAVRYNPIALAVEMEKSQQWQWIPTQLSLAQFEQFVLPHLVVGRRGPAPKLGLHGIFNYILRLLYLGCQWKELPIATGLDGRPEIHYTRIYRRFQH